MKYNKKKTCEIDKERITKYYLLLTYCTLIHPRNDRSGKVHRKGQSVTRSC